MTTVTAVRMIVPGFEIMAAPLVADVYISKESLYVEAYIPSGLLSTKNPQAGSWP
jgi:hypothetical protein